MKKQWIVNCLVVCLVVLMLAPGAAAANTSVLNRNIASGTCGDGISWSLDGYTLTITGSGEITDAPWLEHKDHIENVVLSGGITKVCDGAFSGCDRIETVDFGDALVEIGERAFYGCKDLDYIHLPATFRTFGKEAFRGCETLKYVYCDGGMPRFNDSCLWTGNYISVFFPTNNPWPYEYTSTLISSYGGNLGIMMGNFDPENLPVKTGENETEEDNAEETEAEETQAAVAALAETEAPTEAAVPPTTVPDRKSVV